MPRYRRFTEDEVRGSLEEHMENVRKTLAGEYPLEKALPDMILYLSVVERMFGTDMTPAETYPERSLGYADNLLEVAAEKISEVRSALPGMAELGDDASKAGMASVLVEKAREEIRETRDLLVRTRPAPPASPESEPRGGEEGTTDA